jgi:molybdopterin synthase catalytic subunit
MEQFVGSFIGIVEKKDFNVMKAMKEFLNRNTKGKAGGVLFFLGVVK